MTVTLLEAVAAILLLSASALVLWAIRLCDAEPQTPAAPLPRARVEHEDVPLRRAA
jgi:hypothetical protein